MPPVELREQVELGALGFRADSVIADVGDQLVDLGVPAVDVGSLKNAGQESRLPVLRFGDRKAAGAHHDETRAGSDSPSPDRRAPTSPTHGRAWRASPQFMSISDGS